MSRLSKLAETLIGSEIVRLGNEINNRINAGEKIYNYTIGDFDPQIFPIPKELEQEIVHAYEESYTNYPPAAGLPELRNAVSTFIKDNLGIDYTADEILIASGGRPLIYSLFRTIIDRGDKVVYAVPSWNNNHYTHINEGEHCVIEAKAENNFMPTAEDIEKYIPEATLICLCTPQNPTGTTLDSTTLKKICNMIVAENNRRGVNDKKVYLMFDQMYCLLNYGNTKHHTPVSLVPEMKKYTIFIDGISKSFAATGVRVGWAMGPTEVIGKMRSLLSHIGAWAPMAEQKATANYLSQKENVAQYLISFRSAIEHRLTSIYNGIIELKKKGLPIDAIAPQAAIYLTVKLDIAGKSVDGKKLTAQSDVTTYILNEAKLAIVPFYAFGCSHDAAWYRLSVGTCDEHEINEMISRLEKALNKLNG